MYPTGHQYTKDTEFEKRRHKCPLFYNEKYWMACCEYYNDYGEIPISEVNKSDVVEDILCHRIIIIPRFYLQSILQK